MLGRGKDRENRRIRRTVSLLLVLSFFCQAAAAISFMLEADTRPSIALVVYSIVTGIGQLVAARIHANNEEISKHERPRPRTSRP